MEQIILNNGKSIPALGLGTFRITPEDCEPAVAHALGNGYCLIDTANVYMNERAVARGIEKSGVERGQVFLTSKIWPSDYKYEKAKRAINETLERLNTSYLDLLLLHQSVGAYKEAWQAMEEAAAAGKLKGIGLSNFGEKELADILSRARIKPAVLQVECHPYYQQTDLKKTLEKDHIALEAWYPLGSGDQKLQAEPVLTALARKYDKTPVQIILRWHIQYGNIVIPGSKNASHIDANKDIFDFELTEEEMGQISTLDKNERYFKVPRMMQKIMFTSGHPDFNKQK